MLRVLFLFHVKQSHILHLYVNRRTFSLILLFPNIYKSIYDSYLIKYKNTKRKGEIKHDYFYCKSKRRSWKNDHVS